MNPFTRLKPVRQKKTTLSPILVPACQHITGEWVSHVTSSLRDCEGQARCAEFGGRTERRTERKVKGRWKKGSKERGEEEEGGEWGVIISSPPCLYIFPLLSVAPAHSSHSITQAPRTVRGPGRAFSARRASERYPDHCHCVGVRQLRRGRER